MRKVSFAGFVERKQDAECPLLLDQRMVDGRPIHAWDVVQPIDRSFMYCTIVDKGLPID